MAHCIERRIAVSSAFAETFFLKSSKFPAFRVLTPVAKAYFMDDIMKLMDASRALSEPELHTTALDRPE